MSTWLNQFSAWVCIRDERYPCTTNPYLNIQRLASPEWAAINSKWADLLKRRRKPEQALKSNQKKANLFENKDLISGKP
ncbi:MAG TPA: hypothetical protein VJ911_06850 [Cryomorphaceae bacterium]|nr:hypothetical protein [Cryomorphaceae bacterium]